VVLGFELGLQLELLHQHFFVMGVFMNYLPRLASNLDSPDLCFLSSWDYRQEPLVTGKMLIFLKL
jgi:hypothetical protein